MNWCKLCVLLCSCTLSCNVLIITTTAALQLFHHAASCMQTQCRVLSLTLPLSFFDPAMHGAQKRAMAASHREFCHERQARENRWAAAFPSCLTDLKFSFFTPLRSTHASRVPYTVHDMRAF